jgi:hypothetical protein
MESRVHAHTVQPRGVELDYVAGHSQAAAAVQVFALVRHDKSHPSPKLSAFAQTVAQSALSGVALAHLQPMAVPR